jgi:hypothetical protein
MATWTRNTDMELSEMFTIIWNSVVVHTFPAITKANLSEFVI